MPSQCPTVPYRGVCQLTRGHYHQLGGDLGQVSFCLASHDFGVDPRPRRCSELHEVSGVRGGSRYLIVKVDPPVTTRFWDGPSTEFNHVILALAGGRTLGDIGEVPVMADIVVCPTYTGGSVDESQCSRIGVGSLHLTYAEALNNSPMGDE